jgi:hypothetical protein
VATGLEDEKDPKRARRTPHVMKSLIKSLKMQLSLKERENQAVQVSNQNLNDQDFQIRSFQSAV